MDKQLAIDIETFSDVDLINCGVYKYTDSDRFEILLFAYSVDDGETKIVDLACGEKLPDEVMEMLLDDTVIKTAFNANFERTCHFQASGNETQTGGMEVYSGTGSYARPASFFGRCGYSSWTGQAEDV